RSRAPVYIDAVNTIGSQPARARRNVLFDLRAGNSAGKSRCGQGGAKAVCRELRGLPSQRAGAGERALQLHAVSVPAEALREQFVIGLGADVVSGIRRCAKARPDARGCGCTGAVNLVRAPLAAPAGVDPEPLGHRFPATRLRNLPGAAIFWTLGRARSGVVSVAWSADHGRVRDQAGKVHGAR